MTLGMRLNNPMCIRYNIHNRWLGTCGKSNGFVKFNIVDNGIRAGVKILLRYIFNYHLYSYREIIERYAPSSENDVNAYLVAIYNYTGMYEDTSFICEDSIFLLRLQLLVYGIIRVENGIVDDFLSKEFIFDKVTEYFNEYLDDYLYIVHGKLPLRQIL